MAELTTTSYAILGLLSLREWTTYELAAQMKRSLDHVWPRAERKLYDEPKRLVEAGYARARKDAVGRRPRTIYTITPAGRRALRRWLDTPVAGPTLEFEGILRVLFADQGDLDQLRATLRMIGEQAAETRARFAAMATDTLVNRTFAERIHVNALGMRFMIDHYEHIARWAEWALSVVDGWPDAREGATTWADGARSVFEEAARAAGRR